MQALFSLSGWLAVLALATALVSGVVLGCGYVPSAEAAYASTLTADAWTRALHHHASHATLVLGLVHVLLFLLPRRRPADGRRGAGGRGAVGGRVEIGEAEVGGAMVVTPARTIPGWVSGVLALGLTIVAAYSGRVLPWDTHGAVSLQMAEGFFGLHLPQLSAVLWLHVGATLALMVGLASHIAWRAASELPRRQIVALLSALALLLIAAVFIAAPLGARHVPAALEPRLVRAEWYLRWLQWLGVHAGLTVTRLLLVLFFALSMASPRLSARLGAQRARWLWLALAALLVLLSLLPRGVG